MLTETLDSIDLSIDTRVAVCGALPADVVFTEQATALLRRYLDERGLGEWSVFPGTALDLHDIDYHLKAIGEADATWQPIDPFTRSGAVTHTMEHGSAGYWIGGCGILHLSRRKVILARWAWTQVRDGIERKLVLVAAPSAEVFSDLHRRMRKHRRTWNANVWQFVSGYSHGDRRVDRKAVDSTALFMTDELNERVRTDIAAFFTEPVSALYRSLDLPYRQGVLLHGPPGNGKTSLIRLLGAQLPAVPFMVLRAHESFDADDFTEIIRRWKTQAPAVLVIEDLNWLLKAVNLSTFLNLLDGIDTSAGEDKEDGVGDGLMLVATTNDPAALDPAINNRPGRFDVVIEIGNPAAPLREQFLRAKLPGIDDAVIAELSAASDGFSFAHLQELLRRSGLLALADHRSERSVDNLRKAIVDIRESIDAARRGFPSPLEVPFGLQHKRRGR